MYFFFFGGGGGVISNLDNITQIMSKKIGNFNYSIFQPEFFILIL